MTTVLYQLRDIDDLIEECQNNPVCVDPGRFPLPPRDVPPGLWLVAVDDGIGGELHLRANCQPQWAQGAVWPLRRRDIGAAGWQASPVTWQQVCGQDDPPTFSWRFFPLHTPAYDLPRLVDAGRRAGFTFLVLHHDGDFSLGIGRRRCRAART